MMRVLFLLILVVGFGAAVVYPMSAPPIAGREVGAWRLTGEGDGYQAIAVPLTASEAPLRVVIDLTAVVPGTSLPDGSALTITISADGSTVLARPLPLRGAEVREDSPQTPQRIFRLHAGTLEKVADAVHTITVGPGDIEGMNVMSVDLYLQGDIAQPDRRAVPVGISLMAIGFIGFVLTFRRRGDKGGNEPPAPPSTPSPPRWGRGAADPT